MGWMVNPTPRPFQPRECSGTHCIRGWMVPGAGLNGYEKSRPPPQFNPQTFRSAASRYTDYSEMPFESQLRGRNTLYLAFTKMSTRCVRHLKSSKIRGVANTSLARPISICRRTEPIVSLERRVCSCAELQVFSCYGG